jgi:hypothetical protein
MVSMRLGLGSSGLGECPFSLPTHPVAGPGEAESLQRVADGLGGSVHTAAVRYLWPVLDVGCL